MQTTAGLEKAVRAEGRVLPNQSEVMGTSWANASFLHRCPNDTMRRSPGLALAVVPFEVEPGSGLALARRR